MSACVRASRLLVALTLVLDGLLAALPTAAAAAVDDAATTVIAQGVTALPPANAVWSVTIPSAAPLADATFATQPLGFSLATDGPLLATDQASGGRTRLSRGEAVFNAIGAIQQVGSLGEADTDYLRIVLEPTGVARDAPGDGPIYTSDAFHAPAGDRDLDLLTAILDGKTSLLVTSSKAPALIYAPDGLRYAVGKAAPQDLAAGDAIALSGPITVFAPDESADADPVRVYAAVVGASVPAVATPTAAATVAPTGVATLSLSLEQCAAGSLAVPGGGATPLPCDPDGILTPVPGTIITLENVGTGKSFTLTTGDDGLIEETIAVGDYRFLAVGEVQASTRAVIAACSLLDPLEDRPDVILSQLPLRDGESVECRLYADGGTFDVAVPATVTISLTVYACPSIYTDTFDAETPQLDGLASCDGDLSLDEASPFEGADVTNSFQDAQEGVPYTQTVGPDGTLVFTDLPAGSYTAIVQLAGADVRFRSLCGGTTETGDPLGLAGPLDQTSAQTVNPGWTLDCTVLALFPGPDPDGPGDASVVVDVQLCPNGTNLPTFQGDGVYDCGASPAGPSIAVELTSAVGAVQDADTDAGSTAVFVDLPSGGYSIALPDIDGGAYGLCGSSAGLGGLIDNFSLAPINEMTCNVSILNADDWTAYQDVDTDEDFLTDAQEARLGTDPTVADTDGDGALDGEEVYPGGDPLT